MYSKNDLRKIHAHLSSLLPPGAKPLTAEQILEVGTLLAKTKEEIETAPAIERGVKIFQWRIPSEHAPTMNTWGYWKTWQRARCRKELESSLAAIIAATPGAIVHGLQTMRWVRVTRFTPQTKNVDDSAVDLIGGKMPVDTLKRLGVIVGDSPKHLRREARCEKTKMGNTHVLVEVFAIAEEEVAEAPPQDAEQAPVVRTRGAFISEVVGEAAPIIVPSRRKPLRVLPFGDAKDGS